MKKITQNNLEEIIENEEIENIHFFRVNFSFFDFSEKILSNCIFKKCNLSNINFKNSKLSNVNFISSKIIGVKFSEMKIEKSIYNF